MSPDSILHPDSLVPGALVSDRYRVERYVAEGGMGRIYKAHDQHTGQPVALKLLHSDQTSLEERLRFHQEARALIAIQHPNVARVLGIDEIGNDPCLVMEWLQGQPLSSLIREQRLPIRRSVAIALDIARALECAHTRGIVHRDVKPSNVMIPPDDPGGPREAKLLDFGIAHLQDTVLDDSNKMLGTVLYMSPEQLCAIRARVDARTDLYSLGALMFELLTGQLPIARQSLFALMVAHQTRRPPLAHTIAPQVHPQLARIVGRLLALEPTDRYPSARALISDLERWLRDPDEPFELAQDQAALTLEDTAPLAGRDRHLALLASIWEHTSLGASTSALIYGTEGVGKTRLVREVFGSGALQQNDRHFLNAAQYPASCASPYQTLNALLDAALLRFGAATQGDARDAVAARLREEAGPLTPLLTHSLAAAQALLDTPDNAELADLNIGSERARQIDVVARAMLRLATAQTPVVFAFDDLQWANPATLAVVERMLRLAARSTGHATVVAVWSGDAPPPALLEAAPLQLHLAALDPQASAAIVAGMLQTPHPPAHLLTALWERARGVPFLIEEQLRLAILHDELRHDPLHGWTFTPSTHGDNATSDSEAARRARRIEALPDDARALLAAAAILEHPSTLEELLATHNTLNQLPPERLLLLLQLLIEDERLLARASDRYTLRHRHIQQALLARISKEDTQALHRAALQTLALNNHVEPDRLAWHATQTEDAHAILTFVPPAALQAAATYANEDAERWLNLLLLTAPQHPDAAHWRDALIGALYLLGRYDEALEHLSYALQHRTDLSLEQRLTLLRKRADASFGRGDLLRATEELEGILDALGRPLPPPAPPVPPPPGTPPPGLAAAGPEDTLPLLDPLTRVELATCERLQLVYAFTNPSRLLPVTLRMAQVAARFKNNRWRGQAAMVMGFGLCRRGELRPSTLYFNHARACFEATGSPLDLAWCDYTSTRLLIAQGDLAEAFERVTRAATTFKRYGEQWNRLTCATTGAVIAWLRADLEGIYKMVAKAREVMEHTRSSQHQRWVRRWELSLNFLAGNLRQDDLRELHNLADLAFEGKDLLASIMTLERCAEIHLERNEPDLALAYAQRAIQLMEQHQQAESWLDHLYLYRLEARLLTTPEHHDDTTLQGDLERLDAAALRVPLLRPAPVDARASIALARGNTADALLLLEQAAQLYRDIGHLRRAWEMDRRRIDLLRRLDDPRWRAEARHLERACQRAGWPHLASHSAHADAADAAPLPTRTAPPSARDATEAPTVATPLHPLPSAPHPNEDADTIASPQPSPAEHLIAQALHTSHAARAILYRVNDNTAEPLAWRGISPADLHGPALATGRLLATRVAQRREPLLTTNFEHADLNDTLSAVSHDTLRSLILVPLQPTHSDAELVLYLDRPLADTPFDTDALLSLQTLTTQG